MYYYVYLIKSLKTPQEVYIGYTQNLQERLAKHNSGGSPHTAKYAPWELEVCVAFRQESKAIAFERYLKSGSGNAFAAKRLW